MTKRDARRRYQIQRMLADKLNEYKERENQYVDNSIQEIQELYKEEESRQESRNGKVKEEEVILIKPYKMSTSASTTTKSSFIQDKVKNLMK